MAVTGWKAPAANTGNGTTAFAWLNRNNLHTDNTAVTQPESDSAGDAPDADRANDFWHNFGFGTGDIPDGSTIDGIEGEIRGYDNYGDGGWHLGINVSVSAGSNFGTQERVPASGDFEVSSSANTQPFGGSTSLFGLTIDDSKIRSNDFYVSIKIISTESPAFAADSRLEFMRVRVHFTSAATETAIDVSSPSLLSIVPVGPVVQTGASVFAEAARALILAAQGPTIQTGASVFVEAARQLLLAAQGPAVSTGALSAVEEARQLILAAQGPTAQAGASAFVEAVRELLLVPQVVEVLTAVQTDVDVSSPGVLLLTDSGPVVQAGGAVFIEAANIITLAPGDPTIQTGASIFGQARSFTLVPQGPSIQTGASVFEPGNQVLLLELPEPTIQVGASVAVSDSSIIRLVPEDPFIDTGQIDLNVDRAVLRLCPIGPEIPSEVAEGRHTVHLGKSVGRESVRRIKVRVGDLYVARDSDA